MFIESALSTYLFSFAMVIIFFQLAYVVAIKLNDYSIIDICWGLGFLVQTVGYFLFSRQSVLDRPLLALLIFAWSIRLSLYLFLRWNKKGSEDQRYTDMRKEWGAKANLHAWFKIFLLQPLILQFVQIPILVGTLSPGEGLGPISWFGFGLGIFGLIYESIADHQMAKFKSDQNNQGKLIRRGLWKYSRHPNYFGEVVFWYGVAIVSFQWSYPLPLGILGPLVIQFFLLKVSGVPLLEKKYKHREDFEDWMRTTNALIPKLW